MKTIIVENRKKSDAILAKLYPDARIIDVTSKATDLFVKFSPFYPHKGVPIPFSSPRTAKSVEGIWQGLKVFEKADIAPLCFSNDTMKDLKRTVRKYGAPKGHRKGIDGKELLGYIDARIQIYQPTYVWVLENRLAPEMRKFKAILETQDLVLLDYETNGDILDPSSPLSHAWLIKHYLEGTLYKVPAPGQVKEEVKPEVVKAEVVDEIHAEVEEAPAEISEEIHAEVAETVH